MPLHTLRKYLLGLLAITGLSAAHAEEMQLGAPAPGFSLPDQHGQVQQLSTYRGRWVVLYFYPKDGTPGCTKEACRFRDDIAQLKALGAQVLGISLDSAESHARFAEKHGLPFPLLSDADAVVTKSYGAYRALGPLRFARRHTFIIDPEGRVAKIYRSVDLDGHSVEVIGDLKTLQQTHS